MRAGGLSMLVSLEVQVSEEPFSQMSDEDKGWSVGSQPSTVAPPIGLRMPKTLWSFPHRGGVPPGEGAGEVAAVGLLGSAFMGGRPLCSGRGQAPSQLMLRGAPTPSSRKVVLTWFGGRGRGRLRSEGPSLSGPGSTPEMWRFTLGSDTRPPWLIPELTRAVGGRLPWGHPVWSGARDAQWRGSKSRREKVEGSLVGRWGTSVPLA